MQFKTDFKFSKLKEFKLSTMLYSRNLLFSVFYTFLQDFVVKMTKNEAKRAYFLFIPERWLTQKCWVAPYTTRESTLPENICRD